MVFQVKMVQKSLLAFVLLVACQAMAEKISFPDEELAQETVLPKFDVPDVVLNRNVATEGRLELGLLAGSLTDEALFSPLHYMLTGSYHFTEHQGVNLLVGAFDKGLSNYAKDINKAVGLDYTNAFAPEGFFLLQYQLTAFYGKLSLGKAININSHLALVLGGGQMKYKDSSEALLSIGLGQKFYFSRRVALRFDLRFLRYNGPDPTSVTKEQLNSGTLKQKDFDSTSNLNSQLALGLVFLL